MSDNNTPRSLEFRQFSEVIDEVKKLHENGYDKTRNWDLAQTCQHLSDWMRYPMDGFPKAPFPVNFMLWSMRKTIGPKTLKKILANKAMKENTPTMPETVHAQGTDEKTAVDQFCQLVERFDRYDGPIYASPFFGDMDRDQLRQLQLVHCAHHLRYLQPKSENN